MDQVKIEYKYNEDRLLDEIRQYVDATYGEHYAKSGTQTTEFIIENGHGVGFTVGNIMKYAQRYGKKAGRNRKDILKIVHYAIMLLYVHDLETAHQPLPAEEKKSLRDEYLEDLMKYVKEEMDKVRQESDQKYQQKTWQLPGTTNPFDWTKIGTPHPYPYGPLGPFTSGSANVTIAQGYNGPVTDGTFKLDPDSQPQYTETTTRYAGVKL